MTDNTPLVIPVDLHGLRVDAVLAQLIPRFSRSQLTAWLKEGKISVDNRILKPKEKVSAGQIIQVSVDFDALENKVEHCVAENIPLDIIFEDDHVMVINKPSGLVVHPGAGNAQHTLVNALLYHAPSLGQLPRAGIVHRLDKETTGLLVIAKTLPSHTSLIRQMQERSIQRNYITLVQGHLIVGGEIETCYGRHPRNRLKMAVCQQGREAITHYSIRRQYQTYTLLDVKLLTGRTHQIRVHMAHINHPVVGDPLYGGRTRFPENASDDLLLTLRQFKRQALHAKTLAFHHPETHDLLTFEAPLPDDFQHLIDALEQHHALSTF
ncbi:23S rRNA pseudouridine(1911/1915/1917) synthase RluD [Legionella sp. CNM-4043-24]|uniref:23S rRNA pseudouridine(1911/1915/1917) synthase RluD n=1 Tax=Legionella sp. CNM-4043-24 TaxID=3421646 RepID=UPI00403B0F42